MFPFRRRGQVAVVELFGIIEGAMEISPYGRSIKAVVVDIHSP